MVTGDGRENSLKRVIKRKREEVIGLFEESYKSGLKAYFDELRTKTRTLSDEERVLLSRLDSSNAKLNVMKEELARVSILENKDIDELQEEIRKSRTILEAAGIDSPEKLKLMKERLENVEKTAASIPEDNLPDIEQLRTLAIVDGITPMIKDVEARLLDAKAFDKERYDNLRSSYEGLQKNVGALENEIERDKKDIKEKDDILSKLKNVVSTLEDAKKFRDFLVDVREKVYYRDGPVLKSLRSWAIKEVSRLATEHLELFNINVDGIKLEEVKNELEIKSYQRGREVDTDRLSGGEKVAVALALRLAIGDILGARRLGFFILDEPTVHLDSENKRRLAEVFSALSKGIRQVIVITHDEEVFEEADAIVYKFERRVGAEEYSKVELIGKPTGG